MGNWFVTINLKGAHFHIQIVKRHRTFLRFAFEGKAYQYRVFPFGLALALRMFTKCMRPNFELPGPLADIGQSQNLAIAHRDLVLNHLRSLGLHVKLPRQQTTFLGVDLNSRTMRAYLSPTCSVITNLSESVWSRVKWNICCWWPRSGPLRCGSQTWSVC